jgi:hypothetical protein
MLTITISPQLHQAVKLTKASVLSDSTFVIQSLSTILSPSETKALVRAVINNKNKEELLDRPWI